MSKVCSALSMRRECYSLSVLYFDRYSLLADHALREQEETESGWEVGYWRLLALTCLLLACKMEDGIMSRKLSFEYTHHMPIIASLVHSSKAPRSNPSHHPHRNQSNSKNK